jgi:hypothetical protein
MKVIVPFIFMGTEFMKVEFSSLYLSTADGDEWSAYHFACYYPDREPPWCLLREMIERGSDRFVGGR